MLKRSAERLVSKLNSTYLLQSFEHLIFGFVSYFDIRIWNLSQANGFNINSYKLESVQGPLDSGIYSIVIFPTGSETTSPIMASGIMGMALDSRRIPIDGLHMSGQASARRVSSSLISRLKSFPTFDFGSMSLNSMCWGTL